MNTIASEPLLKVRELKKGFPVTKGIFRRQVGLVKAVDGVSFDLLPGETISLVGESGCGKTTTGRAILQLIKPNSGEVQFRGKDLTKLDANELREMRRHMQIIFQDPFSSLNPRQTVGEIIGGPMILHGICEAGEVDDQVIFHAILMNFQAVKGSVSELRERLLCGLISLFVMKRYRLLMSASKRRSLICFSI